MTEIFGTYIQVKCLKILSYSQFELKLKCKIIVKLQIYRG